MTIEGVVWIASNVLSFVFVLYVVNEVRKDYKAVTSRQGTPKVMFLLARESYRTQIFRWFLVTILLLIGVLGVFWPLPRPVIVTTLLRWSLVSVAVIITFDSYLTLRYWRKINSLDSQDSDDNSDDELNKAK